MRLEDETWRGLSSGGIAHVTVTSRLPLAWHDRAQASKMRLEISDLVERSFDTFILRGADLNVSAVLITTGKSTSQQWSLQRYSVSGSYAITPLKACWHLPLDVEHHHRLQSHLDAIDIGSRPQRAHMQALKELI